MIKIHVIPIRNASRDLTFKARYAYCRVDRPETVIGMEHP